MAKLDSIKVWICLIKWWDSLIKTFKDRTKWWTITFTRQTLFKICLNSQWRQMDKLTWECSKHTLIRCRTKCTKVNHRCTSSTNLIWTKMVWWVCIITCNQILTKVFKIIKDLLLITICSYIKIKSILKNQLLIKTQTVFKCTKIWWTRAKNMVIQD